MAYYNYISLYSFFIFAFYLFLEVVSFIPAGRVGHTSVFLRNQLYIFGGVLDDEFCSNEVFYLDVSQPFNIASPSWNDLTVNGGIPIKSCFGTASLSSANGEQNIYLFGGMTRDIITNEDSFKSLVYKFNPKLGQWEIPTIKGKMPERRMEIKAVSDNSGKIYIFGGHDYFNISSTVVNYFNDMVIINNVELSWSISYLPNAPTQRAGYSATLLSNGVIVYIGGYNTNNALINFDISEINLYDTKSLTWSVKKANITGQIDNRDSHSAVLAPNGKIIIYGGCRSIVGIDYAQVTPDMAVLNTKTFEWTIPSVSSNIGNIPSLASHTANSVGNYMIVAFGNITQSNAEPLPSKNANIYIMDIRNYIWVNKFEPENIVRPTSPTSTTPIPSTTSAKSIYTSENRPDDNNQLKTMKVVIGTMSGVIGTTILMVAGFFGYKRYQRYQIEKIERVYSDSS